MKHFTTYLSAAVLAVWGGLSHAGEMAEVSLLPGWRAADGSHYTALKIDLAPGWKTYWRAPGDTGVPPEFNWRGSRNLKDVEVIWPSPKAVDQFGYVTIGYDSDVVVPLRISPSSAGRDVTLAGRIEIGVCKDICVPLSLKVQADLPSSAKTPDPAIMAAMAARPLEAQEAGVRGVTCRMTPVEGGLRLSAVINMPRLGAGEFTVIEAGDPRIWVGQSETTRGPRGLETSTVLEHVEGRPFALDRKALRFTVLSGGQAVDIRGCEAG